MQWEKLLSLRKQGSTNNIKLRKDQDQTRLPFDVDYDRIIFSDSFRSLQDKTQVIPLSKSAFVHTRLTHSMEVSVVARSLGRSVGVEVLKKYPNLAELGYTYNDFGAIVASAALAHDIGNPPFGHSGEKAIGDFFRYKEGKAIKEYITPEQYEDLCSFEGNANGFRILAESQTAEGKFRLTYAVLGTFIKYPKESLPKKPTTHISDKKYNIFQSEKVFFQEIAQELGLISLSEDKVRYVRHPLAYLVEAADDICYTIIDFEDGVNLGWISEQTAQEYLMPITGTLFNKEKFDRMASHQEKIAYLRALAIGELITDVKRVFVENQELILQGAFPTALIEQSKYHRQVKDIIKLSIQKIYQSPQVVEKELAGYAVLQNLLRIYFTAVINTFRKENTSYDDLILKTIPVQYLPWQKGIYETTMGMVCYIASLTDTKVTELHARCIGVI